MRLEISNKEERKKKSFKNKVEAKNNQIETDTKNHIG